MNNTIYTQDNTDGYTEQELDLLNDTVADKLEAKDIPLDEDDAQLAGLGDEWKAVVEDTEQNFSLHC